MRPLKFLAVISALATAMMFAQSQNTAPKSNPPQNTSAQADRGSTAAGSANSRTWTGTIVNAACSEAAILPGSAPSAAAGAAAGSSAAKNEKSVYDLQNQVMKRCAANNTSKSFAVLTDAGSFYKLDDAGNTQVISQAGDDKGRKKIKNMRVTVTGTVEGDNLKVQSLSKTDKPFGGPA